MTFPIIQKYAAAGQLLNQQITFTSLNQVLSAYVSIIMTQAVARGMTRVGSSNGTTGAFDGVNRWSSTAATRGATTTTAQSWDLVQHANGSQTLIYYTGTTDDIAGIASSPGGLYTLAGTPTFKPTASDECLGSTGVSLVGVGSGNRVANVWIDSAHNGIRAAIFRANVLVGPLIWSELFDPAFVLGPGASVPVPTWCGCLTPSSFTMALIFGQYAVNSAGGQTRMIVSGGPVTVSMGASGKALGGTYSAENGLAQELNGSNFFIRAVGLSSVTTGARGDVGNRFDFYTQQELKACGELDASRNWLYINNNSSVGGTIGVLWPWDGSSNWIGS